MINLSKSQFKLVKEILEKFLPGIKVCAFGSRTGKNAKPFSDLDLVIMGDSAIDSATFLRLQDAFEDSDLTIRVDVVDWHAISASFQERIRQDLAVVQDAALPKGG